jgi:hypothetical protein
VGKWMLFTPYAHESNETVFRKNGFELIKRIKMPWWLPISLVKEVSLFKKI